MTELTLLESNEEGCIYQMGRGGYVVDVFACRGGPDRMYFTMVYDDARELIGEQPEEPLQIILHENDDAYNLMCEYPTLGLKRLRQLAKEQGFKLVNWKIIKEV